MALKLKAMLEVLHWLYDWEDDKYINVIGFCNVLSSENTDSTRTV